MMKVSEFASKIRTKYPGSYDGVGDQELAEKVVAKFPQYQSKVDLGEGISKSESFLRGGAQGLSLGASDEAAGAAGAVKDYVTGNKSVFDKGIGDLYRRNRDESRGANLQAQQANPKSYMAGQIPGAIAPMIAATALGGPVGAGGTIARLGALGAVEGLGYSQSDLTAGDPSQYLQAGKDIAVGGTLGAAIPYGMGKVGKGVKAGYQGLKTAAPKLKPLAAQTGKRALSAATGPEMEAIEGYLKRPKAFNRALNKGSYATLAEGALPKQVGVLSKKLTKLSDKAYATLKNDVPVFTPKELMKEIGKLQGGLKTKGQLLGPQDQAAFKKLGNIKVTLEKMIPKKAEYSIKGKTYPSATGGPALGPASVPKGQITKKMIPQPKEPALTEGDLKAIIQKIDKNINWKNADDAAANKALKALRFRLNQRLGQQNPAYRKAMEPVAIHMELLENLEKKFGLTKSYGEAGATYKGGKTAAGLLEQVPKEKNIEARAMLKDLQKRTGGKGDDLIQRSDDYRLAKQFESGYTRGSRNVAQYAITGAGAGAMAGGPVGGFVGGVVGAGVGSHVDKFGGQYAKRALDKVLQVKPEMLPTIITKYPQMFGQYAEILRRSLEKGTHNLAVTHYTLQQMDPEYRKQLENIRDYKSDR